MNKTITNQELAQLNQIEYSELIASELELIVCTCPMCGNVQIQPTDQDNLVCPHCGVESDFADFPDLFFNGMTFKGVQDE